MRIALWIVQALLFATFAATGLWKLVTPVDKLAGIIPWAGQVPPAFLYAIAAVDFIGGVGVLLPSLLRIKPQLSVLAALGCAALMACAIVFHIARGEAANTPFNALLLALSLFVAWGRSRRAPITPR